MTFTAGIGENNVELRVPCWSAPACSGSSWMPRPNASASGEARISSDASAVAAFVVPTNEEREIAMEAVRLLADA